MIHKSSQKPIYGLIQKGGGTDPMMPWQPYRRISDFKISDFGFVEGANSCSGNREKISRTEPENFTKNNCTLST